VYGELICSLFQVTINRVVTEVRFASIEPPDKRRTIKTADIGKRFSPINCSSLFSPEFGSLI